MIARIMTWRRELMMMRAADALIFETTLSATLAISKAIVSVISFDGRYMSNKRNERMAVLAISHIEPTVFNARHQRRSHF